MSSKILVWDIPTRLCHWLLVASLFYAWFSVDILEDMEQHFLAGYSALTLLLFRLIWGFIGTDYARFSSFLFSTKDIIAYSKTLTEKDSKPFLGHNPLGGLSVLVMLFVIGLQTLSGLFNNDDYFFGALNYLATDTLEKYFHLIHQWNFDLIVLVIAVHIMAIIFYRVYKNQHLSSAMIHGKKLGSPESLSVKHARKTTTLIVAAIVFTLCAGGVFLLATALPEPPVASDYY